MTERRWPVGPPGEHYTHIRVEKEKKKHLKCSMMANSGSGSARGRVRLVDGSTTTAELLKMTAILQPLG